MACAASRVLAGVANPLALDSANRSRHASRSFDCTQHANRLERVWIWASMFRLSDGEASPVAEFTRVAAVAAATARLSGGPAIAPALKNCDIAYAVATVVNSLTTTPDGASGPRTAARRTAAEA